MELSGIDSILYKMGQREAFSMNDFSPEVVALLEQGDQLASLERWTEVEEVISKLHDLEQTTGLRPCELMCTRYLQGRYCEGVFDPRSASDVYVAALDIARTLDDEDSAVVLANAAAAASHDALEYSKSRVYFELAYDVWSDTVAELPMKPVDAHVTLLAYLGRELWLEGNFEAAQQRVGSALTLLANVPESSRLPQLNRDHGHCLWLLALVFRSESDRLDGDLSYLTNAHQRMAEAQQFYAKAGVDANNQGRYLVQCAEVGYDVAEVHLSNMDLAAARAARRKAYTHARNALQYFAHAKDGPGKLLARLALIRNEIMWRPWGMPYRKRLFIDDMLTRVARGFEADDDKVGVAKVATVRAEWYLLLGDTQRAQKMLTMAHELFKIGGVGMATRAARLQRRLNLLPDRSYGRGRCLFDPELSPRDVPDSVHNWN